jgi:hypothetical protein
MASQRSSRTSGWFLVAEHHVITSWVLQHALNLMIAALPSKIIVLIGTDKLS